VIDFQILKKYGTTNERVREVLTAGRERMVDVAPPNETRSAAAVRILKSKQVDQDVAYRQRLEYEAMNRLNEGILFNLRNYQFYAAADLAWDSCPVNKFTMPLILYAQGLVKVHACKKALEDAYGKDSPRVNDFVKKGEEGLPESIDLPKFLECNINLVRSFLTRRLAAQANKFSSLYPFFKADSRSTGLVGKLRADVLSQRFEIMTDDYGYRHHHVQCIRDAFLYGHCVDFVASAWDVQEQWTKKDVPEDQASETEFEVEAEIQKEGVLFENIHPSRVFWDKNSPLSSLNTDTGVGYIGYWDVKRYGDVYDCPDFFNKQHIGWTNSYFGDMGMFANYPGYFEQYGHILKPPIGRGEDPAGQNDRKANAGIYSGELTDASIILTVYFKKLIPRDYGIGDYPFPVWMRFIVAGDSTFIFGEILPSTPGAYLGINESDSRLINVGLAHELMSYQDQLTNLFTAMLKIVQQELVKVYGINTDALGTDEAGSKDVQVKALRTLLTGKSWGNGDPIVVEYSLSRLTQLQVESRNIVTVTETRAGQSLTSIFEAMARLIQMAEKLTAMSPAEQGQPAPREISATEVTAIASTTTSVYSFISSGIDEFRAAIKKLLYESTVACQRGDIYCPVQERYTEKTILAAGFKAVPSEKEDFTSGLGIQRHTVIGSARRLNYAYIFRSRDGDERAVNSQAANTLVQLLSQFIANPTILAAMGKEKLFEIVNEIFRMSGAGIDLNLALKPGESNDLGDDQVKKFQEELQQVVQGLHQLAQQTQQNAQDAQQQKTINQSTQQHFQLVTKLAIEVQSLVGNFQKVQQAAKESITIAYKDMPESIKRQAEAKAGFTPATEAEGAMAQANQMAA
jgi:hypothetical protein